MVALALQWAGYLALGLVCGAAIWAASGQQHPIVPKLVMGVAIVLGWVLGMALRRKLTRG